LLSATENPIFASTTKIPIYISETLSGRVTRPDGSQVSMFLKYVNALMDTDHIVLGDFNPGVQPRGTPITAETVYGGAVDVNVMWRDAQGRVVSSSWSKSSGWDMSNVRAEPMDGRD
jgi:hypothetical protein